MLEDHVCHTHVTYAEHGNVLKFYLPLPPDITVKIYPRRKGPRTDGQYTYGYQRDLEGISKPCEMRRYSDADRSNTTEPFLYRSGRMENHLKEPIGRHHHADNIGDVLMYTNPGPESHPFDCPKFSSQVAAAVRRLIASASTEDLDCCG